MSIYNVRTIPVVKTEATYILMQNIYITYTFGDKITPT